MSLGFWTLLNEIEVSLQRYFTTCSVPCTICRTARFCSRFRDPRDFSRNYCKTFSFFSYTPWNLDFSGGQISGHSSGCKDILEDLSWIFYCMNLFIRHYRSFIRKKLAIFRPLDRVERRFAPFSNVEFQYASIGEPSDRFSSITKPI